MDQVKTIALAVWQQRFWVLSVIGILIAVYCWNSATTELAAKFSSNQSVIKGKFSDITNINSESFHPNDSVNQAVLKQVDLQKNMVGKLWNDLYQQQKNEVLFWPELGNNFAQRMGEKRFNDDIELDLREQYSNYIKKQFDKLRGIVKASDLSTMRGGRTRPRQFGYEVEAPGATSTTEEPIEDYLVDWLDQATLKEQLSFENSATPSSVKVWVTQEDIWVYTTLLNVIANTNKRQGATRPDNTAIRRIIELQVGKEAGTANLETQAIYIPTESGEAGFNEATTAEPPPMPGQMAEFGGSADSDESILDMRYLDETGAPLTGGSGEFGREYRKLPIRMVLMMDQRLIPQVLVECANAPLPIEVTRLCVNKMKSIATGFSERSPMASNRQINSFGGNFENTRNLSTIEFQGIVLIYQPPDESYLPEEAAEEEVATEVSEEPTT